ncbi:MAG: hypothetical protein AMXMBFR78_12850 [Rubrivivax sp.]
MIIPALHRQVVPMDNQAHRNLRVKPMADWRIASALNSAFITASEMIDACREYPIVFVNAGKDAQGADQVAPVAVFGLSNQENLFLDGPNWRATYMPAVLRLYPFVIGRLDAEQFAVCIDASWSGFSQTEGQPLFDDKGELSELGKRVSEQLQNYEVEVQRTRNVCARFHELGLLDPMRFDLTATDGRSFAVDGFMAINEEKYRALPDDKVLELHRNGLLALLHAHMISMRNMQRLGQWKMERLDKPAANG